VLVITLKPNYQHQSNDGERRPLAPTGRLASSFLHPLPDSWWKGHCSSPFMPVLWCQYHMCTVHFCINSINNNKKDKEHLFMQTACTSDAVICRKYMPWDLDSFKKDLKTYLSEQDMSYTITNVSQITVFDWMLVIKILLLITPGTNYIHFSKKIYCFSISFTI